MFNHATVQISESLTSISDCCVDLQPYVTDSRQNFSLFNCKICLGGNKINRCSTGNWSRNWKHDYQAARESQKGMFTATIVLFKKYPMLTFIVYTFECFIAGFVVKYCFTNFVDIILK